MKFMKIGNEEGKRNFARIRNIGQKRYSWKMGNSGNIWNIGEIGIKGKIREYLETKENIGILGKYT